MSDTDSDIHLAKQVDLTIRLATPDPTDPRHVLGAIRVALATLPDADDITESAAGLILDVLHGVCDDWLATQQPEDGPEEGE